MVHIVISSDHHVRVIIHLILLGSTAFIQTHFTEATRYSIIVVLSHVAHHLHMVADRTVLAYL